MADFNNPSACYCTHQFNIATFQYPFNGNMHRYKKPKLMKRYSNRPHPQLSPSREKGPVLV